MKKTVSRDDDIDIVLTIRVVLSILTGRRVVRKVRRTSLHLATLVTVSFAKLCK